MDTQDIAYICYCTNSAYVANAGNHTLPWQDVKKFIIKAVNVVINNPTITSKESHDQWLEDKLIDGWKYGPRYIIDKKEHPEIKKWEELTPNEKFKEKLFLTIVKVCLKHKE